MDALRKSYSQNLKAESTFGYRDLSKIRSDQTILAAHFAAPQESFIDRQLRMPKEDSSKVPDLGKRLSKQAFSLVDSVQSMSRSQSMRSDASMSSKTTKKDSYLLTVTLIFKYETYDTQELPITIHKDRDVQDVYDRT